MLATLRIRRLAWFLARSTLVAFGLFVSLLTAEGAERLWEWEKRSPPPILDRVSKRTEEFRALISPIPDDRLGDRVAPYAGGHDANGFRNDSVPKKVDIVAIGDSQTWGLNADRSEAWPQTLARLSGFSVYQMAKGGYGPVQYLELTNDALHLSPKIIVIGFHFGNDLYDAYYMVYGRDRHAHFRKSSYEKELLLDTIDPKANALQKEADEFQPKSFGVSWRGMVDHSALLRLLERSELWSKSSSDEIAFLRYKGWAVAHPDHGMVYEGYGAHAVFDSAYRLLALDLDEPRIAEGLRISKEMLMQIQEQTTKEGVLLIVLLIPTKERVYADLMQTADLSAPFTRVVQMERRVYREIVEACSNRGIHYVDGLPGLQEALRKGEQIYPVTYDGHPNAHGYLLLASAVHNKIREITASDLVSQADMHDSVP